MSLSFTDRKAPPRRGGGSSLQGIGWNKALVGPLPGEGELAKSSLQARPPKHALQTAAGLGHGACHGSPAPSSPGGTGPTSEVVVLLGDWESLNNRDLNNAICFFLLFKLKFIYSTSVFISGDFCKVGPHEPGSFKRRGSIFPLREVWPHSGRLSGRTHPCRSELQVAPGVSWLVAASPGAVSPSSSGVLPWCPNVLLIRTPDPQSSCVSAP